MVKTPNPAGSARRFHDGVSLPELVHFLREGVYIMDAAGAIVDANPVAVNLLGLPDGVDGTAGPRDQSRTPEVWRTELEALARDGAVREFRRELLQPDGTTRTVVDTCYARMDNGQVSYHGIVIDISVIAVRDPGVARDAHARDPVTGAYTAEYLDLLDTQRLHRDLGFCMVGLPEPQELEAPPFERMTRFLLRHIRATEFVVRASDTHLVIVLPDANDRATEIVARRLQLAALRGAPCPFTLGWAVREVGESVHTALERALAQAVPVRVVERAFDPTRPR